MKVSCLVAGQYTYSKQNCLGKGAWGAVYKAVSNDGRVVALKKMNKFQIESSVESYNKLQKQILALQQLKDSEHIIKFVDVFRTEGNYYIVTEYIEGSQDLLRYMSSRKKRFTELQAIRLWKGLLLGVEFLHSRGIIHRDLKLQNVLYAGDNNQLKIIDFGLAVTLEDKQLAGVQVGSPMFMSPQVLLGQPYSSKCDIWSLGIVFYFMLFGEAPYGNHASIKIIQQCMQKMQKKIFELPHLYLMTEESKEVVLKCLQYEEKDRPTAKQLLSLAIFAQNPNYLALLKSIEKPFETSFGLLESDHKF